MIARTILKNDDVSPSAPTKKKEQPWTLEPHVCRECFCRVASRLAGSGLREYVCVNCGTTAEHSTVDAICCCGIKIKKQARTSKAGELVDAGVRCVRNPDPTPQFPNLYVATEVAEL